MKRDWKAGGRRDLLLPVCLLSLFLPPIPVFYISNPDLSVTLAAGVHSSSSNWLPFAVLPTFPQTTLAHFISTPKTPAPLNQHLPPRDLDPIPISPFSELRNTTSCRVVPLPQSFDLQVREFLHLRLYILIILTSSL